MHYTVKQQILKLNKVVNYFYYNKIHSDACYFPMRKSNFIASSTTYNCLFCLSTLYSSSCFCNSLYL